MSIPVFEHTLSAIRAHIRNESEPLHDVADLIKYDPGLYFSFMKYINSLGKRNDITSISQAISLVGAEGTENFILQQDYFIDEDYLLLWCYAVLAGEAAVLINERAGIAEEEEAFFAGILPAVGMLLMTGKAGYKKIVNLLLKIPFEHRMYIEEGIYKSNHIEQLDQYLTSPKTYKDILNFMKIVFTKDGHRRNEPAHPAKLSMAYKSFELFRLIDVADTAARSVLFPAVVVAQEKFRELSKMYFKMPENEIEEFLSEIVEKLEMVCKNFKVEALAEKFISEAENYRVAEITTFLTKSEPLKKSLENIYAAVREGKNIFIYGEPSAGKRLLAIALHRFPDNPRRSKPFISIHCGALDSETLENEVFGAKAGFMGMSKHKGALELANGGTILLKDIDKIPLTIQDRFAEVFSREVSSKTQEARTSAYDIKFMLTSQNNIFTEAEAGRFSQRLLKVISPVSILIPPLRNRREDIEFIADSIIEKYNLNLTDKALRLGLCEYYEKQLFPDNLRDLKRFLFFLSAKHSLKS